MKTIKFFLAMSCLLGLAANGLAQNADTNVSTKKTSGIQNARAAALRALKTQDLSAAELPPPATTPSTGKFVFNITIDVNPGLPTTAKIFCSASATTSEFLTDPQVSFFDDGFVAATRTGATAKCSITLPYGWFLSTPTKDPVGLGVDVTAETGTLGTTPTGTATSTWSHRLPAVPATGTTTTETITTAI